MSKTTDGAVDLALLEKQAQNIGLIDAGGFFAPQSDWEFELDMIPPESREALEAHLAKPGADNSDTAAFVKAFLMGNGHIEFTPFED